MSLNIHAPGGQLAAARSDSSARAGGIGKAAGEWNGLKVKVTDAESLLANAAEEVGFAASEKVEKLLSKRRKPEAKGQKADVVPPPQEKLQEMREAMGGRLKDLLDQVRQSGGNPAALKEALQGFPDPTERHAAMQWLEEQFEAEPSLKEMVQRERRALEAASPSEIQAGYNLHGLAAEEVGGPEAGTDLYRRTILGHGNVTDMLEEILKKYGTKDLEGALDFLRRAVGVDLSATNSSTDKRELEAVNNDLYHMRAIGNFSRQFEADLDKLRQDRGKTPLPGAGVDTLRVLFKAKDQRLVQLDGLKTALKLEGRSDPEYDVQALSKTRQLARNLPAKLFTDEDSRQRLLGVSQKLLDTAIDLEDEMRGGQE